MSKLNYKVQEYKSLFEYKNSCILIRLAEEKDFSSIIELAESTTQLVDDVKNKKWLSYELLKNISQSKDVLVYVIEYENKFAGFSISYIVSCLNEACLHSMALKQEYRNKKISKIVFPYILNELSKRVDYIWGIVEIENFTVDNILMKNNFICDKRKYYYYYNEK